MNKVLFLACLAIFSEAITGKAWAICPKEGNGEFCTYRFDLMMSKSDQVCKHMGGVFNWSFTRMFDLRGFSQKQKELLGPIESNYPSSEEFDAVSWQYPKLFMFTEGGPLHHLPVAEFDIDNDGKEETVIKGSIFSGAWDSEESLTIYTQGDIDLTRILTMKEWTQGQVGKRPRIIYGGAIIRPFILKGVSHLMMYEFFQPEGEKGSIDQPPQTLWIRKYLGGGQRYQGEATPQRMEDVCKFNMIRIDAGL